MFPGALLRSVLTREKIHLCGWLPLTVLFPQMLGRSQGRGTISYSGSRSPVITVRFPPMGPFSALESSLNDDQNVLKLPVTKVGEFSEKLKGSKIIYTHEAGNRELRHSL